MPSRQTLKSSHVRHVSNSSNDTVRDVKSTESYDLSRHQSLAAPISKIVTLWVHDENFSKDEVLVDPDALGKEGIRPGDLIEIIALKTTTESKDFQQQHDETSDRDKQHNSQRPENTTLRKSLDHGGAVNVDQRTRYLCVAKPVSAEFKVRHPQLQVSVTNSIANTFGFRNRSQVVLSITDHKRWSASHVELIVRDEYIARSDMWRLVSSELVKHTVYKGEKILFLGTIKAVVNKLYVRGRKVKSAYFSENTVPIFRSESARYVLFIQMSREMWDFDSEGSGEILFSRVINGFLPDLFKKWEDLDAKHLVSIVMFGRLEYDQYSLSSLGYSANVIRQTSESTEVFEQPPTKDFYRVVVSDMASGQWTAILDELKKEFRVFLRDVCLEDAGSNLLAEGTQQRDGQKPKARISGRPSTALRGNILEAINIASSQFASDYIDRDLVRTGISIVIITPGAGVFEVERDLLSLTSENLTNNGIGIDLVCLSKMPLHSVPLFKYHGNAQIQAYSVAAKSGALHGPLCFTPTGESTSSPVLGVSPLASVTYGSMPRSLSRFGEVAQPGQYKDWSYGIPQWIDLSYWTSNDKIDSYKAWASQPQIHKVYLDPRQATAFEPRVRMYELQMMGVMELGLANIAVPYLSEGQQISQRLASHSINGLQQGSKTLTTFRGLPESPESHPDKGSRRDNGPYHSTRTRGLLSVQAKQQRNCHARMEEYDNAVFFMQANQKSDHQKADDASPTQTSKGPEQQETDLGKSKRIALLNTGGRRTTSSASSLSSTNPGSRPVNMKPRQVSGKPAPRVSQSITFALRGFAPPPRATASIEINVENAQAGPLSTGNFPARPPATSSGAIRRPEAARPDIGNQLMVDSENNEGSTPGRNKRQLKASRPISIRSPGRAIHEDGQASRIDNMGSLSTTVTNDAGEQGTYATEKQTFGNYVDEQLEQLGNRVRSGMGDSMFHRSLPENITPWIKNVYPSNPTKNHTKAASWVGRWQHLFPRTPKTSNVKWRSLCTPASVPLTTEEFPTCKEFETEYQQKLYIVSQDLSNDLTEVPKNRETLLREMIALRLAHGYQLVVGQGVAEAVEPHAYSGKLFEPEIFAQDGSRLFMSMGNTIQKLASVGEAEVHVTKSVRKLKDDGPRKMQTIDYSPCIRTTFSQSYTVHPMRLAGFSEEYPWEMADAYLAGRKDHLVEAVKRLRFWRARFVLIPVEPPASAWRPTQSMSDENEEEIHLLGITALTQTWQRYRYIPTEEGRRFKPTMVKRKDPNPLEINFQTLNTSEVVVTEIDKLLAAEEAGEVRTAQLLPESELLERATCNVPKLAQIMQSEKGVEIVTRRWHLRLHYNCFKGDEFTTWLLQNFKDIETRDEAVDFGHELMQHGLFQHVEKRHNFKDGNYFYQIDSEYRTPKSDLRDSWFRTGRRGDRSVPSTPITEALSSPLCSRSRSGSNLVNGLGEQGTPNKAGDGSTEKRKLSISLSKMMHLDVDHRKRSSRPEIINLHYDRLHNPENCYHLELSWLNVTSKLVEDAIVTWATQAERYGLKLVEVPIAEVSSISDREPFRAPYRISLKAKPLASSGMSYVNGTTYFTPTSFTPQVPPTPDHLFYHKALLKKYNFVLDLEAASEFPPNVDITYSWGKLDYRFSQFVHRSGVMLAQITDEGDFLLLANRLYNTRSASTKDAAGRSDVKKARLGSRAPIVLPGILGLDAQHPSPHPSPLVRASSDVLGSKAAPNASSIAAAAASITPEQIKDDLEAFCHDVPRLEAFYREVATASPAATDKPTRKSTSSSSSALRPVPELGLETSIPDLRLPASIVAGEGAAGKAADVVGLGMRKVSPQPMDRLLAEGGKPGRESPLRKATE